MFRTRIINNSVAGLVPVRISAGSYLPGAHHPHCDRYAHHLIWIAGRPMCLGCTALSVGAILGIVSVVSINWTGTSVPAWILIHLTLLLPTFMQPWFQRKWFKIASRGALGAAVMSYWITGAYLIVVPLIKPLWLLAMAAAFGGTYIVLRRVRDRRSDNPCANCPQGVYPTCDWNLPRLLQDPAIATDLKVTLQSDRS
jgi:hypothetical protein